MTKVYLPTKVDPFRFADNATQLHGSLLIKNMSRLCESLGSDDGDVEVNLNFGLDEQKVRFLKGHLTAYLKLQCQRCLELFDYKVTSDFILGIVQTEEEADHLSKNYDPLMIKGNELFIQDVIEDELIISLPIVAMHELKQCKVNLPLKAESARIPVTENENPFKVIELLRKKREE